MCLPRCTPRRARCAPGSEMTHGRRYRRPDDENWHKGADFSTLRARQVDRQPDIDTSPADSVRCGGANDDAPARIVQFQSAKGGDELAGPEIDVHAATKRSPGSRGHAHTRAPGPSRSHE